VCRNVWKVRAARSVQLLSLALLTQAAGTGCSSSRTYFPLEVGKTWTYHVRAGLAITVEDVKVMRRLAVAGTVGYEVGGHLGFSRLAWKNGVLMADSLPNTRFSPPMPMLVPGDFRTVREADALKATVRRRPVQSWQGFVETMGRSEPAKAELYQEEATLRWEPGGIRPLRPRFGSMRALRRWNW